MSTKITDKEREISHPLEEVFDIEENTTIVPYKEVKTDLVPYEPFDVKDEELESQLQDLYDMAIEAFENQQSESDTMEARFKARNAEVAAQYLKTALEAVREKRELKQHKDRIINKKGPGTVNNIILDRNEIIKMIQGVKPKVKPVNTIDADFEEQEDE